jgi:hypothetical protein
VSEVSELQAMARKMPVRLNGFMKVREREFI